MNFLEDYSKMTFLERREAICRWHLSRARFDISKYKISDKWAVILNKMLNKKHNKKGNPEEYANYNSQLYFYTGKDEAGKEVFDGTNFNKDWLLRKILIQDGVFEVEKKDDVNFNIAGTWAIAENLMKLGIEFYIFWHEGGRAPHIHIYNLFPRVDSWAEKEMHANIFANKIVPSKYLPYLDRSLFGEQQIALEFSKHFKNGTMNKLLFWNEEKPCTA